MNSRFVKVQVIEVNHDHYVCFSEDHQEYILLKEEAAHQLMRGAVFIGYTYRFQNISYISQQLESKANYDIADISVNQEVDLFVLSRSQLGFKCLIDGQYIGLLYHNEIFQPIEIESQLKGYIKAIREDHRIDLILRAPGHKATADISDLLLEKIKENNGFLNITDKTDAEVIYQLFHVSKKKFKIALGQLYKARKIKVEEDGLYLVK